jgi:hypothetical protein
VDRLAESLGVSPDLLQGQIPTDSLNQSVSGWDAGGDGKITLVMGLIVLVAAVVMFVKPNVRKAMAAIAIVAGLVGGGIAVYDLTRVNDVADEAEQAATGAAGTQLEQAGISQDIFDGVFDVSAGIGLWACLAGGLIAVVGGIVALKGGADDVSTTPMAASAPAPASGTGFEPAAPAPTPVASEPPPSPAPPVAPSEPEAPPPPPATPGGTPAAEPPAPGGEGGPSTTS